MDMYLFQVLQKYSPRNLVDYSYQINQLQNLLKTWAGGCYVATHESGSRAKGTAISIASDVDYMVSLTSNCNQNTGGLESIYSSLHSKLSKVYPGARRQNVSIGIEISGTALLRDKLKIDITPARKWSGSTNDHSLWVSKQNTWKKTNILVHIDEISKSGRLNEIKLLKIWRELNKLDFPSIYLEYLLINILRNKPIGNGYLSDNFEHVLAELARSEQNPLLSTVNDPASSTNVLSDLLKKEEKAKIYSVAKESIMKKNWSAIIW